MTNPAISPDYDALLDELIKAHQVIGLDRKWHARQSAARSSLKDYVAKIEEENEEYKAFGLTLRCENSACSAFPSVYYCTRHDAELRASLPTPEEAAWAQTGWLRHHWRKEPYCACAKCENLSAKLSRLSRSETAEK